MYGITATFKFKQPLTAEQIETIREQAIKPMTDQPGFRHYYAIAGSSGEVASFHAWDSREQAEAALAVMGPRLQPLIQDLLAEAPVRVAAEVVLEFHG